MRKRGYSRIALGIVGIVCILALGACEKEKQVPPLPTQQVPQRGVEFITPGPNSFDSADTAVVISKDTEEQTITFLNLDTNRKYTLFVVGSTTFADKYGEVLSFDQVKEGEIGEITFLKNKKRLNSFWISNEAWSYESLERYEINPVRKTITVGTESFQLTDSTTYFSQGKIIEMMDLNAVDTLTIKGIGNHVLSVDVTKGHGYLRLKNEAQFWGGFIEIGSSDIRVIEEDMLLTVPEGTHQVVISHKLGGGEKKVSISRNRETELDIGDLEIETPKQGNVIFSMTPSNAVLYVDGTKVDAASPVLLPYGIHQIIARAEGYSTLTSYIKVASESGGIDVTLEKLESEKTEDQTSGYKIYIDQPEGAEVFLDGNYIGMVPVSTKKTQGVHSVTLRKNGCVTRSYTIHVDSEAKDVTYSFAELEIEEKNADSDKESRGEEKTSDEPEESEEYEGDPWEGSEEDEGDPWEESKEYEGDPWEESEEHE